MTDAARSPISERRGVRVRVDERWLTSFAGCDTLGLACDAEVLVAAHAALATCGLGASASRTTSGTWTQHVALEAALAQWFAAEGAVLLPCGWTAGAALAHALRGTAEYVLLDEGVHPALAAAAESVGLPVRRFGHFDVEAARAVTQASKGSRPLVMTDALDLTSGTSAPLEALVELVEQTEGRLIVDDAHGVGVLGAEGRGTTDGRGLGHARVNVTGSLSKALGAHGGFMTGTAALCERARTAPVYPGATPIPPVVAAGAAVAVRRAARGPELRERVLARAARLRDLFLECELTPPAEKLPWFSVGAADAETLAAASADLAELGFQVPHLRYHGAPAHGLLRISVSAAHTAEQIDELGAALADVVKRHDLS